MSHHIAVTTGKCPADAPASLFKAMMEEVKAVHQTLAPLDREVLLLDKNTGHLLICVFGLTVDLPLEILEREVQTIVDTAVGETVELVYNKACS